MLTIFGYVLNFTCKQLQIEYLVRLQGRVKFPTGGDSPQLSI
ncbi:hypothetical protein LROSL1_1339 [Furfurilactobacillus rossiae]|nr:hypothetical protein LROSL1_1339 [Furfurilactobacillus rossiae]